jgi:hypothetical protein
MEQPAGSMTDQVRRVDHSSVGAMQPAAAARSFDLANVPWTLRDVAWATVIFGCIFGSFAVALLVLRFIQQSFASRDNPYVSGVLLLILESALTFPVWLFTAQKYGAGWEKLGFRRFRWTTSLGLVALLLMASFMTNALWAGLLSLFGKQVQPDILPLFGGGHVGLAIAWLAAGVVAPLVEEIFFRGFLLPPLMQRNRFATAAAINGLIFGFIHFTPTAIVPLFILGVMLCVVYRVTGSLWPSIIMHATMNTLAVLAAYAVEIGAVPVPGT